MPEEGGAFFDETPGAVSDAPVKVRRVPLPLSGNARYQWRIATVLRALSFCRGKSATLEQLHTLVWALADDQNAAVLEEIWESPKDSRRPFRGYVPRLLETLRVLGVEGLVEQAANGRQKLTEAGAELLASIEGDGIALGEGERFLAQLAPISATELWRRLGEKD